MTTVTVFQKFGSIVRIEICGHSGYAAEGEDIVCAAITSSVRYAEIMLNSVLDLGVTFVIEPERAFISFSLPDDPIAGSKLSGCHAVFTGFARHTEQLAAEYPNNLEVMEVQHNA